MIYNNKSFLQSSFSQFTSLGFTLIEVMVSVSIISVIMATVLYNYGDFNAKLAISGMAQEMAIAIRQAQTYGLTVREVSAGSGEFGFAYGMHFDPNLEPQNYYIFADKNNNQMYDGGFGVCGTEGTECVEKLILRNNITISDVCDQDGCNKKNLESMDVTFLRPNPDAQIYFTKNKQKKTNKPEYVGKIVLSSNKGFTTTITVESTGQVSVR